MGSAVEDAGLADAEWCSSRRTPLIPYEQLTDLIHSDNNKKIFSYYCPHLEPRIIVGIHCPRVKSSDVLGATGNSQVLF